MRPELNNGGIPLRFLSFYGTKARPLPAFDSSTRSRKRKTTFSLTNGCTSRSRNTSGVRHPGLETRGWCQALGGRGWCQALGDLFDVGVSGYAVKWLLSSNTAQKRMKPCVFLELKSLIKYLSIDIVRIIANF